MIVFGPLQIDPTVERSLKAYQGVAGSKALAVTACNCIGPQPGQKKCPCVLRGEAEMGAKMITEGVTVNGRHYRLVPT